MQRPEVTKCYNTTQEKYRCYKFSLKIRKQLKPLTQLDNWHGPLALLEDYTLIFFSILVTCYLFDWFYPISLLVIGSRQRALATLLHESAHGTLAKNRLLNWAIGTFGSGYLIFQQMTAYKASHCLNHHSYLGHPEHDPDFNFYQAEGLYKPIKPSSFLIKYVVQPLLMLRVLIYLKYLVSHRLFSKENDRKENIILLLYWTTIVGLSIQFSFWDKLLLFWLIPYLTVFQMLGWFIELSEHYPLLGNNNTDLYLSRNRFSPWYEAFFTSVHNENLHLVHHLLPNVPFWNQPKAHQILMTDLNYRSQNELTSGIFFAKNHCPSILSYTVEQIQLRLKS